MFVDKIHLIVQGGRGGNGCESYLRRTDRKLVPNGGDGGRGGAVIFRADRNIQDLAGFRFKQNLLADAGGHGGNNRKRGKNGHDLIVLVPSGTRIMDRRRNFLIRDLSEEGDEVLVASGGAGGAGNDGGKKACPGEKGAILDVELSFQIPADVFFVGLPNSGKSTLLNRLTRTRLGEKDYPFSTRHPEIGVYEDPDDEPWRLCELPSLYSGSHEGRGMGTEFLRHLEKAKCILYCLDPLSKFSSTLQEGFVILRKEIESFNPAFLGIAAAVIVNKIDLAEAREKAGKENFEPGLPSFRISAKTGEGLEPLMLFLGGILKRGR